MRPARLLLAVLALALCGHGAMAGEPTPLGAPGYDEFEKTMTQYPHHAAAMRRAQIRSGLPRVKPCMSKSEIRALLGAPDYGQQTYGPKGPGETWLGSSWTYYLSTQDEALSRIDLTVDVFFDTHDRAQWIVPTHIRNAKRIGSPAATCAQPGAVP